MLLQKSKLNNVILDPLMVFESIRSLRYLYVALSPKLPMDYTLLLPLSENRETSDIGGATIPVAGGCMILQIFTATL